MVVKIKLALINMPCNQQEYIRFDKKWDFIDEEYLGINILHTIVETAEIEVLKYEESIPLEKFKQDIFSQKIKIIVISIMQTSAKNAFNFIKELKEHDNEIKILIGGWFVKNSWREIFQEKWLIDAACISDAEGVFDYWIKSQLENSAEEIKGIVTNKNLSKYLIEFDKNFTNGKWPEIIYSPKRNPNKSVYGIETSRGCSHSSCSFCSLTCSQNKRYWKPRSLSEVVKEIEYLVKMYGTTKFTIIDDDFLGPAKQSEQRAEEFLAEIKKRKLKIEFSASISVKSAIQEKCLDLLIEAGLKQLCIGFESVDDEQLDRYRKPQTKEENYAVAKLLRTKKIKLVPGLITFDAFATPESIEKNIDFLFNHLNHFELSKLTKKIHLITGTPMVNSIEKHGLLEGDYLNYEYRFYDKKTEELYRNFEKYTELVSKIQLKLRNKSNNDREKLEFLHKKYSDKILKFESWRELLNEDLEKIEKGEKII